VVLETTARGGELPRVADGSDADARLWRGDGTTSGTPAGDPDRWQFNFDPMALAAGWVLQGLKTTASREEMQLD